MTVALESELDDLIVIARLAGDHAAAARWADARDSVRSHGLATFEALSEFLGALPPGSPSADALRALLPDRPWVIREQAIAHLPSTLRWLFENGAFPLAALLPLTDLDIVSLGDMAEAIRSGVLRGRPNLGETWHAALEAAIDGVRARVPRLPIGRALDAATPLLEALEALPMVALATPVGSLRRGHDLVGDVELLAVTERPEQVVEAISSTVDELLYKRAHRLYALQRNTQIGIRTIAPANAAVGLVHLTGSTDHLRLLREAAVSRRLRLDRDGLRKEDGRMVSLANEQELYHALGFPFIAPELRNGTTELTRARERNLPELIERQDILGDFHTHTRWSDGRDSVEDMVRAAVELGYRYIAITDHSPSSSAARSLLLDDIERQADEIAGVRERYPQITILHGCEVDILPSGELDFSERTLRRFDIVLASLHQASGHSPQQLLRRYLAAMVNPYVTIITHLTNRLFPHRSGYALDYDRVFEAAVETATILEIDGAPSHIDMDAGLAARAIAAGVDVAIDSDAHAAESLGRHMQIGLLTARRAGVEPRHVLNTRPWAQVRAAIARKRGRGRP